MGTLYAKDMDLLSGTASREITLGSITSSGKHNTGTREYLFDKKNILFAIKLQMNGKKLLSKILFVIGGLIKQENTILQSTVF